MVEIIRFPGRPTLDDLIRDLESTKDDTQRVVAVRADKEGRCEIFSFNANAAVLAFFALVVQQEAVLCGDLVLTEEDKL